MSSSLEQEPIRSSVLRIFVECMLRPHELVNYYHGHQEVEEVRGTRCRIALHPGRLGKHRDEIGALLRRLSPKFFASSKELVGEAGFTFMALPFERDETQWGEHIDADRLLILAIGSKQAEFCSPVETWAMLPGGMPYVRFTIPEQEKGWQAQ